MEIYNNTNMTEATQRMIDRAIESGSISIKQKNMIIAKAKINGDDVDEVEIMLETIHVAPEPVQNMSPVDHENKVRKCPYCGERISPIDSVCPSCGFILSKHVVNTTKAFFDSIQKIENNNALTDRQRNRKIINIIRMFPIPNDVENVLEFLSISFANASTPKQGGLISSRASIIVLCLCIFIPLWIIVSILHCIEEGGFDLCWFSDYLIYLGMPIILLISLLIIPRQIQNPTFDENEIIDAWRTKFGEVLSKAKTITVGLNDYKSRIEEIETEYKRIVRRKRTIGLIIIPILFSVIGASYFWNLIAVKNNNETTITNINHCIREGDYNTAYDYYTSYKGEKDDVEKQAIELLFHFVEQGDYKTARTIVYSTSDYKNSGKVSNMFYQLLLERGKYDEAAKYIPGLQIGLSYPTYVEQCEDYYSYLLTCIYKMCDNKEFHKAKEFLESRIHYFILADSYTRDDNYVLYKIESVRKRILNEIKYRENGN